MSKYDGCNIKLRGTRTMLAVDNGKKRVLSNPYEAGLRRVFVLSEEEFLAIPFETGTDEEE